MSPRPRSVSDQQLMLTAVDVVIRRGAENTRLSDVSEASGLAPATLIQRFGSREGLIAAVAQALVAEVNTAFAFIGVTQLERLGTALFNLNSSSHFAFFGSRPDLAGSYSIQLRKQIAFALAAAVESGELAHCDIADRARRIQLAYFGLVCAALLEGQVIVAEQITSIINENLADYV
jgi:AcrR family transcriptional regulator